MVMGNLSCSIHDNCINIYMYLYRENHACCVRPAGMHVHMIHTRRIKLNLIGQRKTIRNF